MKRLINDMGENSPEFYEQNFFDRALKGMDERDLKRWQKLIQYYKGGRFIDLGCLDSIAPILIKEEHPRAEVWGIDIAEKAITEMSIRFPHIYYQLGNVYNTSFPNNYFGYAVAGEIVEHLDDPEKFIAETFRILRKDGVLAISVPLGETGIGEVDKDRHIWGFEVEDMYKLLGKYGRVKTKIMGSDYFPKYKYHFPTLLAFCWKK